MYVWPLFAVYGVYMALTDGVGRALVTDFVPPRDRATAIGIYTGVTGAMILVSSVLAGVLWDTIGASARSTWGRLRRSLPLPRWSPFCRDVEVRSKCEIRSRRS